MYMSEVPSISFISTSSVSQMISLASNSPGGRGVMSIYGGILRF